MFSRIVVSKRKLSWKTGAICARSDACVTLRRSWPSTLTTPASGSRKRSISPSTVLLPQPLGPTIAIERPAGTVRLTPVRFGRALV